MKKFLTSVAVLTVQADALKYVRIAIDFLRGQKQVRHRILNVRRSFLSFESLEMRRLLALGDLRIVSYNILAFDGSPSSDLGTVLQAIGNETINARARPIDVLAIQEVRTQITSTAAVVSQLNAIYGPNVYSRGNLNGTSTSGNETVGLVFNTQTVQLINELGVGTHSTNGAPRQTIRYQLRPVGLPLGNDFYVYNSHYKASPGSDNEARRQVEALSIRANSNALPQGTHIIYAGDYNIQSSSEDSYQTLLASGNGQAFDPINTPGVWNNNSSVAFRSLFTQAPLQNAPNGFVGGGLDDRFDFQLLTGEWTDNLGLEYFANSYRVFGNNGSLPRNSSINSTSNTALTGMANRTTILNLLTTVSDHLPVVADYYFANQTPTFIDLSPSSVAENAPVGTTVGTLTSVDPNAGDTFTYNLVSGTGDADNSSFAIVGNQLRTSAVFDFETKSSYTVRVRTTDQFGAFLARAIQISITNVNEAPTSVSLVGSMIAENLSSNSPIGTFSASDPDANATFTFALVSGTGSTDNSSFTIAGNQLRSAVSFDFEVKSTYSIRVRATDQGGLSVENNFSIHVVDANDAPVGSTSGPYSTSVNQLLVLNGTATDQDTAQMLSFAWDLNYNGTTFDTDVSGANPQVQFSVAGLYTIALLVSDNGSPSLSNLVTTTVNVTGAALNVQSVQFGDGSNQRSLVKSILVNFDTAVTWNSNAFVLEQRLNGAFVPIAASELTITAADIGNTSGSIAQLTFSGSSVIAGSLADGNYRLTVKSNSVQSSGQQLSGGDYIRGELSTDRFFRLFGDVDGFGSVNGGDFNAFRTAFGSTLGSSNFNPLFNFDAGTSINGADFNEFRARFGRSRNF